MIYPFINWFINGGKFINPLITILTFRELLSTFNFWKNISNSSMVKALLDHFKKSIRRIVNVHSSICLPKTGRMLIKNALMVSISEKYFTIWSKASKRNKVDRLTSNETRNCSLQCHSYRESWCMIPTSSGQYSMLRSVHCESGNIFHYHLLTPKKRDHFTLTIDSCVPVFVRLESDITRPNAVVLQEIVAVASNVSITACSRVLKKKNGTAW